MDKAVSTDASEGALPEDVLRRIRIPFVQRASLTHRGCSHDVFIIDIGLAGVFVEKEEGLPLGDGVLVRFPLPGNELPIVARCRVAWCRAPDEALVSKDLPQGAGLAFDEISDSDRERIRRHVLAHCQQSGRARRFLRHWPAADPKGEDP